MAPTVVCPMTRSGLRTSIARQSRRPLEQGVGGNLRPGTDDAAEILALRGDRIESRRGAEVGDDQRQAGPPPELLVRRNAVGDSIGADFGTAARKEWACPRSSPARPSADRARNSSRVMFLQDRRQHRDDRAHHHGIDPTHVERWCANRPRRPSAPARRPCARAASPTASSRAAWTPSNTPRTMLVLPMSMARSIRARHHGGHSTEVEDFHNHVTSPAIIRSADPRRERAARLRHRCRPSRRTLRPMRSSTSHARRSPPARGRATRRG